MADKDQLHCRMRHGICYNCGKVPVSQAFNCVKCQIKLNERAQLLRWDRQADAEEVLRTKKGLIPSEEAAEILGITLPALYTKVARGEVIPIIKGTGRGATGYSWYKRSELPARG